MRNLFLYIASIFTINKSLKKVKAILTYYFNRCISADSIGLKTNRYEKSKITLSDNSCLFNGWL